MDRLGHQIYKEKRILVLAYRQHQSFLNLNLMKLNVFLKIKFGQIVDGLCCCSCVLNFTFFNYKNVLLSARWRCRGPRSARRTAASAGRDREDSKPGLIRQQFRLELGRNPVPRGRSALRCRETGQSPSDQQNCSGKIRDSCLRL